MAMLMRNIPLRHGRPCLLGLGRSTTTTTTARFSVLSPRPASLVRPTFRTTTRTLTLTLRPGVRFAGTAQAPTRKLPERLLIYHAGTPRTTFLACLKVTTLFGLAFFTFLVAPAYAVAGKPWLETAGVAVCGLVPFALVTYTTAPFVAFVHLRLPPFARGGGPEGRTLLRRFVANLPPQTRLDITTMSLVGRARVATVAAGDLVPAHERLRIVNVANGQASAAATATTTPLLSTKFPWIRLPPPTRFGAPHSRHGSDGRHGSSRSSTYDAWAWDEILDAVEKRAQGAADEALAGRK